MSRRGPRPSRPLRLSGRRRARLLELEFLRVRPVRSDQGSLCLGELPEGEDHHRVSDFVWSADSSKVLFADARSGFMSLVVVQMPSAATDPPRTVVYPLTGAENVCEKGCTPRNVRALAWEGDRIEAVLAYGPEVGRDNEVVLAIPLSRFLSAKH